MSTTSGLGPTRHTLTVPGATLAYGVRGDLADCTPAEPPLLLFGSPMDSTGFTTLASHFPDRVVVTYDPRNTGRSVVDDTGAPVTAERHAEDLHALVERLGVGPVDMFGTSGGAMNALARRRRAPGGRPGARRARTAGRGPPPGSRGHRGRHRRHRHHLRRGRERDRRWRGSSPSSCTSDR